MDVAHLDEKIAGIQGEMEKAEQAYNAASEQMQSAREIYQRQHGYLLGMQELRQELLDNGENNNDAESTEGGDG